MTRAFTSSSICGELLARDGRGIGEVEPQPVVVDLRALLLGVLAEVLLQGVVQQVRGRVGAADALAARGVDPGGRPSRPARAGPRAGGRRCSVKPPSTCVSMTSKRKPGADELARVAHLAAHLAVEGRLVEHDGDRLLVADLVDLVARAGRWR